MSRIIFLDRDGVINRYPGDTKYITSWKKFKFLPHSLEAIKKLTDAGYKIFVVSNQAGVSKGIYSKKDLDIITQNMLREINKAGGKIREVCYCLHSEKEGCLCRKPKPGLINKTLAAQGNNKYSTVIIGDDIRDIRAGQNAKLKTILVLSGKEKFENRKKWLYKPDYIFENLLEAAEFIINNN